MTDDSLTRFQIDLLAVLAGTDGYHGQDIKALLEADTGSETSNARVYTNLDTLIKHGLVSKTPINDRANRYALTEAGDAVIAERAEYLTRQTRE